MKIIQVTLITNKVIYIFTVTNLYVKNKIHLYLDKQL